MSNGETMRKNRAESGNRVLRVTKKKRNYKINSTMNFMKILYSKTKLELNIRTIFYIYIFFDTLELLLILI